MIRTLLKTTIIGLVLLLVALLVGATFSLPRSFELRAVMSGSMEPTIRTGSIVFIQRSGTYVVNDVVTFQAKDDTVTHRIIEADAGGFRTKGDANEEPDADRVPASQIWGKVQFSIPLLGYLVALLRSPQGFIFLIVIPGALLIWEELRTLKRSVVGYVARRQEGKQIPTNKTALVLFCVGLFLAHFHTTNAFFSDIEATSGNSLRSGHTFATLFDSNDFTCSTGATNFSDPDGFVTFAFGSETVEFKAVLYDGIPHTFYDIWVNQDPGGCPQGAPLFPQGMQTDVEGNAEKTFNVDQVEGAEHFWISVVGGGQVLRSTAIGE